MDLTGLSDDELAELRDQAVAAPSATPAPAGDDDLGTMSDQDLLALREHVAGPKPPDESHNFVPFLKNTWQGVKDAADTFSSKPLPSIAYDSLVQPAVDTYQKARAEGHNPLVAGLSAAVTGTGRAADAAKAAVMPQSMPVEAYFRSRQNGNSAEDALLDARNVAALVFGPGAVAKTLGVAGDLAGKAVAKEAGITPATMARYRANPEAVNSAAPLVDQTKKFLGSIDDTSKDLSQGSSESFQTLKNLGATLKPEEISQPLNDAAASLEALGNYGPERKGAVNYLKSLAGDVSADAEQSGGGLNLITWDKGKSLIGVLDSKIEAVSAQGGDTQVLRALGDARKAIDTSLKNTSPEYAAQMAEQAKKTEIYRTLADKFRSDNGAMSTLKRIQTGKDPFAAEALQGYDKQFGTSFGDDLQNSAAKQAFSKDTTNGSRKAKVGAGIGSSIGAAAGGFMAGPTGAVVGSAVGGAVGGAAGAIADKYGGQAVKVALDAGIKVDKLAGTPYLEPIMEAAKQGPQKAAVAHYIWAQSDTGYQMLQLGKKDDKPKPPADEGTIQPVGIEIENDDDGDAL